MADSSLQMDELNRLVQRWQIGDREAADALYQHVNARMEHLSRRMLRQFPHVRRLADTDDVLQGACWRLLRALQDVNLENRGDFFNLAALQIRRELLDLARYFQRRPAPGNDDLNLELEPQEVSSIGEVELWTRFHEAIEKLDPKDRAVFNLAFYHGMQESEIAKTLEMSDRSVRRHRQAACSRLTELLEGKMPKLS